MHGPFRCATHDRRRDAGAGALDLCCLVWPVLEGGVIASWCCATCAGWTKGRRDAIDKHYQKSFPWLIDFGNKLQGGRRRDRELLKGDTVSRHVVNPITAKMGKKKEQEVFEPVLFICTRTKISHYSTLVLVDCRSIPLLWLHLEAECL